MLLPVQAIIIVGLAAVWIWVLGRPVLQNLFDRSRRDPIGHFNREMSVLGSVPGRSSRPIGLQSGMSRGPGRGAKKRRLQIFLALGISAVVSLILAVIWGHPFVYQHLVLDVLLVGYIALAAKAGAAQRERGSKVTVLKLERTEAPAFARAANGR